MVHFVPSWGIADGHIALCIDMSRPSDVSTALLSEVQEQEAGCRAASMGLGILKRGLN